MHDFQERVLHGLSQKSSFKMMVWGDDSEFKNLENQNKICSSLTEDEKNLETRLSKQDKQEIAEVTQLSVNDVNDVFAKYKQLKDFHKFLKDRRQRNDPMPESREDLMMIYRIERPSFMMKKPDKYKPVSPANMKAMKYRKHT